MENYSETRALVSAQKIIEIKPAQNADALEVATVQGWECVIKKGQFSVGDLVAYFEIDSFLPLGDERYAEFANRTTKKMVVGGETVKGCLVRTARIRGNLSQGLVLPLASVIGENNTGSIKEGDDITSLAGVWKFVPDIPDSREIIGGFTSLCPKSDATRLQSMSKYWEQIRELKWTPTIKVDGSSHTFTLDGVYSRNYQLNADSSVAYALAKESGILDTLEEGMAVQAELVGPGVQKNRLSLDKKRLFVFAVFKNGRKVPREQWDPRLVELATPKLGEEWDFKNFNSLSELVGAVSGIKGNVTDGCLDEGIVWHCDGEPPLWMPNTGCVKIISNEYLIRHKI